MLSPRAGGGVGVRLLGGILGAALALVGCTMQRAPVGEGPPFLRVAGVARVSDLTAVSPPAWAPDGRWIAFSTQDAVWAMHPDGSAARRLAPLPDVTQVAWTSDGRAVAAAAGDLYTLGLDGLAPRVAARAGQVRFVAVSPRGDRMAYVTSAADGDEVWTQAIGDRAGERPTRMALPGGLTAHALDWLSDGRDLFLALGSPGAAPASRLLRIRIARPRPTRLGVPLRTPVLEPVPASNGRFLAYLSGSPDELRAGHGRVVVTRLDGTGRRILTAVGAYTGLAWSPSGTMLAFGSVEAGDRVAIEVVDVTTGARLVVLDYRPEIVRYEDALAVRWAPDGLRLAFGTDTGTGVGPVWVATLTRL